ncbi:MAG: glycoside hydrolase family 16 protein [Candidatus Sumerlaeota bacterium]|nr:glycoside hydrolase family 16 protein [Candidatus Sumerlaeota bacterium]
MRTSVGIIIIAFAICVAAYGDNAPTSNQEFLPPPPDGKTWKMIWNDEFDGVKIDDSKWTIAPDGKRKDGWWSTNTVSLDGKGRLVMQTRKDGDKFVDGSIRTRDKFEHKYGYYVARAQLHNQPGHWPAFWLQGAGTTKVGDEGRDGTEVDIMEKPWLNDQLNHALHWDGYGKDHKSATQKSQVPGIMEGYHIFSLWWTPEEYVFYVDGKETWRTKAGGVCQVPIYIILSDEIGKWGGDITQAKLPDSFIVDYVRVYDLESRP